MIIATVTALSILLFSGGGFSLEKYYKSFVKDVVQDEARQEQIIDLTKKADMQLGQYRKEVEDVWASNIKSTFGDFDATEDDFKRVIATAEQSRIAMQQRILDVRMSVKELMSEDEWNTMYELIRQKEMEEKAKKEKKEE